MEGREKTKETLLPHPRAAQISEAFPPLFLRDVHPSFLCFFLTVLPPSLFILLDYLSLLTLKTWYSHAYFLPLSTPFSVMPTLPYPLSILLSSTPLRLELILAFLGVLKYTV